MSLTRPYLVGLVGTGVTPSLSPPLHMTEAAALGFSYVYRPIDLSARGLSPDDLAEILTWAEHLGFDALNITHPCKRSVLPLLDDVDPLAAALGAVNTVVFADGRRVGYNTDTTGFERALATGLPTARLERVVLLGAGGAGSAVADALLRRGVRRLDIVDRDVDRAGELAVELAARHAVQIESAAPAELDRLLPQADGVVHCTPTGMHDHPGVPFGIELLRPDLWVADIVYRPLETELLRAARALGCETLDGGRMAVFQAVHAFELITGRRPDAERMRAHFQSLVAADDARP